VAQSAALMQLVVAEAPWAAAGARFSAALRHALVQLLVHLAPGMQQLLGTAARKLPETDLPSKQAGVALAEVLLRLSWQKADEEQFAAYLSGFCLMLQAIVMPVGLSVRRAAGQHAACLQLPWGPAEAPEANETPDAAEHAEAAVQTGKVALLETAVLTQADCLPSASVQNAKAVSPVL